MTARELAELVLQVLHAQKTYFKTRAQVGPDREQADGSAAKKGR